MVKLAADIGGVKGIGQGIVERALHRMPIRVTTLSSVMPSPLLAGLPQEDLLQIIPLGGAGLVQIAEEKVLLSSTGTSSMPHSANSGIRAAPLHKAAQPLHDGLALVQVGLGQARHLGDVVLQGAKMWGRRWRGEKVSSRLGSWWIFSGGIWMISPRKVC